MAVHVSAWRGCAAGTSQLGFNRAEMRTGRAALAASAAAVLVLASCLSSAAAFTSAPSTHHLQQHRAAVAPGMSPLRKRAKACATTMMAVYQGKPGSSLLEAMTEAVAQATKNDKCKLESATGGGFGGGGGASTGAAKDASTGKKYFYKSTGMWGLDMLNAEYRGIKEMYDTKTIRVPEPICVGTSDNKAFVVFEYLSMGGSRSGATAATMGKQLAQMHRRTSKNGKFGWDIENTIGATPQPNGWRDTWVDFWDEMRLGHMLKLCAREGADFPNQDALRAKVRALLSEHNPEPSLLHGDLWTGNVGATDDGEPTIFDPATYYGDREADIAMTELFGSLSPDFYRAYNEEWPLPPGHEKRKVIYNLYHILNHIVLFGGGYRSSAQRMIDQIMKM